MGFFELGDRFFERRGRDGPDAGEVPGLDVAVVFVAGHLHELHEVDGEGVERGETDAFVAEGRGEGFGVVVEGAGVEGVVDGAALEVGEELVEEEVEKRGSVGVGSGVRGGGLGEEGGEVGGVGDVPEDVGARVAGLDLGDAVAEDVRGTAEGEPAFFAEGLGERIQGCQRAGLDTQNVHLQALLRGVLLSKRGSKVDN